MREGLVLGSVTSTVKHPSLNGKKMLVVQILDAKGNPEGRPEIISDFCGAGKGDRVFISWDGIYMTEVYKNPQVPIRAWICGIVDKVCGRDDK
jgi:ethanolamine utilization protein EutN